MPAKTIHQRNEALAIKLVSECWNGDSRHYFRQTVDTLRRHYLQAWDETAARKLLRNNLQDAFVRVGDPSIDTPVFDVAETIILEQLERMYEYERD